MKKCVALPLIAVLAIAASPAWAKPKTEIVIEVVNIAVALSHSPSYHPAIPDSSTTVCTPNGERCITTTTPGHPASLDNLEFYSQFLYAIMPGGRHVTLRHSRYRLVYPPEPGNYTAETDGGKVLILHVLHPNAGNPNGGKPDKLDYRIVGTW